MTKSVYSSPDWDPQDYIDLGWVVYGPGKPELCFNNGATLRDPNLRAALSDLADVVSHANVYTADGKLDKERDRELIRYMSQLEGLPIYSTTELEYDRNVTEGVVRNKRARHILAWSHKSKEFRTSEDGNLYKSFPPKPGNPVKLAYPDRFGIRFTKAKVD